MNPLSRIIDTLFRVYHRPDLTPWEHTPAAGHPPIYGVYHIMMERGWQQLARQQFEELKASGLLDASTRLFVSCITTEHGDARSLKAILNSPKVEIVAQTSSPQRFEYPALEFIRSLCTQRNCFVYYFHSKGISYQAVSTQDPLFLSFKRKIDAWRGMLQHFIFHKWRVAVNALACGHDTYGCYRWPPRAAYTMYSGNFWWARAEHIRSLPELSDQLIAGNRFFSETWLFQTQHKQFSAFDTMADLYFVRIPRSVYTPSHCITQKIAFVATYNWRKFQKHILHRNYKTLCQQRFQQIKD